MLEAAGRTTGRYEPGHEPRTRNIGRKPSRARIDDYTYWRYRHLSRCAERDAGVTAGALPDRRYEELRAQAAAEVLSEGQLSEADLRVADDWAPTSTETDDPARDSEMPVIAAVLSLKHIGWMLLRLARRTGQRGPAPKRRLVAATILHMAFSRCRPEVWETAKEFTGANALLHWAYNYPADGERRPDRETFYKGTHEALSIDSLDPGLIDHIQVETFRQLAEQVRRDDTGTPVTDKNGRPVMVHPKAAVALIADGSFTEGQVQQTTPLDDEHLQIRLRHRADRDAIRFVTYSRDGNFTKSVVGYKLVSLVCAVTTRCVISAVVPANAHEPDVVLFLLQRLFHLWPECPAQYLVGDALYGHGKDFLRQVMFDFGLDPVFPWRADYKDEKDADGNPLTIKGVPVCRCLKNHPRPMVFKQRKGKWWGPRQRREGGLPHGQQAPAADLSLRYEFVCPSGICPAKTTRAWDKPGVHTYLPHTGEGRQASLRRVLLRQRNIVESHYASLQRLGMQGRGVERPQWANDVEVAWLLGLSSTFLTARRLVFENGLYERARRESEELHLLDHPTQLQPSPGPTGLELSQAKTRRIAEIGAPAPPDTWVRECGGRVEPHTGSAATWALEWGVGLEAVASAAENPPADRAAPID